MIKNKKLIYSLIVTTLMFFLSCSSSNIVKGKVDKNKFITELIQLDTVFIKIDSFLRIEKRGVDFNVIGEPENYDLYVLNLLTNKSFDIDVKSGVFMFLQPSSHPYYYIYLKNIDGTIKILDFQDNKEIESLFIELSMHFKKNNITDKKLKLKYLFGITKYLNSQYDYPVSIKCLPNNWECDYN